MEVILYYNTWFFLLASNNNKKRPFLHSSVHENVKHKYFPTNYFKLTLETSAVQQVGWLGKTNHS